MKPSTDPLGVQLCAPTGQSVILDTDVTSSITLVFMFILDTDVTP